jgi:large subunit ribosomal protein L21
VYAIVKTGGKQYKVAVGDVVQVEKVAGGVGDAVALPALLVVDGATSPATPRPWPASTVSGEVVAHTKGPKINILRYKNKTGYKRRMGHRQQLTQVRVTDITTGK